MEKVTVTLAGKPGSFYFQPNGLMHRGAPPLSVEVVPDSGAGELTGLSGHMTIEMKDGAHHYVFDYTLPPGDSDAFHPRDEFTLAQPNRPRNSGA